MNDAETIISAYLKELEKNPSLENYLKIWSAADGMLYESYGDLYAEHMDVLRSKASKTMTDSRELDAMVQDSIGAVTVAIDCLAPNKTLSYIIKFPRGGDSSSENVDYLIKQVMKKARYEGGLTQMFNPNESEVIAFFTTSLQSKSVKARFFHYGFNNTPEIMIIQVTVHPLPEEVQNVKNELTPPLQEGFL